MLLQNQRRGDGDRKHLTKVDHPAHHRSVSSLQQVRCKNHIITKEAQLAPISAQNGSHSAQQTPTPDIKEPISQVQKLQCTHRNSTPLSTSMPHLHQTARRSASRSRPMQIQHQALAQQHPRNESGPEIHRMYKTL